MTAPWLALHIFCRGDQDSVIVDLIFPTLRRLRTGRWLARYFFIRYWNGGPHLRVRMQCLQPVGEVEREFREAVEPLLDRASSMLAKMAATPRRLSVFTRWNELSRAGNGMRAVETIQPSGTIKRDRIDSMRNVMGGAGQRRALTITRGHRQR